MKRISLVIFLSIYFFNVNAQSDSTRIKLLVSSRVDTSSANVRAVLKLYENYLNSHPDSIYDNPYWNKREKELYKDFDFSRQSMFQGGMTPYLLSIDFPPFVMSVEPLGNKYQIRVLYSSPTTDPKYVGSKVWCIQKLNAVKENNKWYLENLIVELTKKWENEKYGNIEYIYPPTYKFDTLQAIKAEQFCNTIIKRFNPSYHIHFKYYVTDNIDDMGLLKDFDYFFVGITDGQVLKNMILTAKGNEFFPHEFVHQLLPENQNRGDIINEGIAVFLGTKVNEKEYESLMQKLAVDLVEDSGKINFKSVISQTIRFNGYPTEYPAGAAICELVYNSSC